MLFIIWHDGRHRGKRTCSVKLHTCRAWMGYEINSDSYVGFVIACALKWVADGCEIFLWNSLIAEEQMEACLFQYNSF